MYALGLVLVEAVTGGVPFAADTTIATLMGRVGHPVAVPDELGPLAPVLRWAGSPSPADRPDAPSLAEALEAAAAQLPPPLALPLTGGEVGGAGDSDDVTDLPGRPVLFDGLDGRDSGVLVGGGAGTAGAAGATGVAGTAGAAGATGVGGTASAIGTAGAASATGVPGVPRDGSPPAGNGAPPAATATRPSGPVPDAAGAPAPDAPRGRRRHRGRWLIALVVLLAVLAGAGWAVARALRPSHPVPNLTGRTVAEAQSVLRPLHLGLHVSGQDFDERVPKGAIVRQRPAAAKSMKEGSTVSVDVSAGRPPVAVPDLTGLTPDQAGQRLAGAGLAVGTVSRRPDNTVPDGMVISWSGQGGQLPQGTPVDLVVSTGKPQVPVPDVHGMSVAQAQTALAGVGLGMVANEQFSDAPVGQIVGTTPAAGANAPVGSQVAVIVSKGPDLVTVPNVTGQGVQVATSRLEAAGLTVSGVVGSPDRAVTATSPAAGSRPKRGTAVRLYTS